MTVAHRCNAVAVFCRSATVAGPLVVRTYVATVADRRDVPDISRIRRRARARKLFATQCEPSRRCATVNHPPGVAIGTSRPEFARDARGNRRAI